MQNAEKSLGCWTHVSRLQLKLLNKGWLKDLLFVSQPFSVILLSQLPASEATSEWLEFYLDLVILRYLQFLWADTKQIQSLICPACVDCLDSRTKREVYSPISACWHTKVSSRLLWCPVIITENIFLLYFTWYCCSVSPFCKFITATFVYSV